MLYEGVSKDDSDFTAVISKIRQARADLVFWGGLHSAGGLIVRQMREQGVKAPLMGGDGITDDEFAAIAGPGAEGTLMTFSPDPRQQSEQQGRSSSCSAHSECSSRRPTRSTATPRCRSSSRRPKRRNRSTRRKSPKVMRSGMVFNTVLGDSRFDSKGDIAGHDYVMNA